MDRIILKHKIRKYIRIATYYKDQLCSGHRINKFREDLRIADKKFLELDQKRVAQLVRADLATQRKECLEKSVVHSVDVINKLEDEYIERIEALEAELKQLKGP